MGTLYRGGYEQAVATARAQMGEQAFTAAWAEGRTMTPEQALAAEGPAATPHANSTRQVSNRHLSQWADRP